ncbi:MAG: hypothetical protein ACQKBU_07100, partial [Verrucomicrobiales bacterium]
TDTVNPQLYNPHNYTTPGGVNDGEELWQELVRKHNFVLTLNGHVLGDGTGFRTDPNDAGQNVHQMLANYQFLSPFGGNGFLRLLVVNPDGTVEVKSYSPLYNEFLSDADQAFEFDFEWYAPTDTNENGQPDYFDDELDSDGDGLSNYDEFVNRRSNPFEQDSDGDGMDDDIEAQIGTHPAVDDRETTEALLQNAELLGYYTEAQISDLHLGHMMIQKEGDHFRLNLQPEMSDSLENGSFSPTGDAVEWSVPASGDKAFLRVRARDSAEESFAK